MAERKELLNVFDQMELVVVADMTMGDSAMFADIVLPVTHWFEVNDMHGSISQVPYLTLQEKAIEPLYECKSDWEIVSLLGEKMGFGEYFNMTDEEVMKATLDSDYARLLGLTYEKLKEEKVLRDVPEKPFI